MKITLWVGLIVLFIAIVLFFLSGSSLDSGPMVPALYNTNQLYWMLLGLVGLIVTAVGITGILARKK
jgi:hypothetical protein